MGNYLHIYTSIRPMVGRLLLLELVPGLVLEQVLEQVLALVQG